MFKTEKITENTKKKLVVHDKNALNVNKSRNSTHIVMHVYLETVLSFLESFLKCIWKKSRLEYRAKKHDSIISTKMCFGEGNGTPLQYFVHLMRRVDTLEKTLMLEGIGGRRRRG